MKAICAFALAAAVLAAAPASAQRIDLSTIKCKDFIESGNDNIGYIMMWLDGYFADEDEPAIIDFDRLKAKGERLGKYCASNPEIGLITAAEPIMER